MRDTFLANFGSLPFSDIAFWLFYFQKLYKSLIFQKADVGKIFDPRAF